LAFIKLASSERVCCGEEVALRSAASAGWLVLERVIVWDVSAGVRDVAVLAAETWFAVALAGHRVTSYVVGATRVATAV
jgi:hypothetical protein